ncbi:peptide-methionine (S)-S-oxide reductase [Nitrosospira sp. Nsp5]|uniref:Peptide methionine sulfoxide reductase MsrA n=1 Tax=Nitrosospira multiformis TaxID=1231 RepID=A0ABY0TEI3_9PROT|nr:MULTISPECIES: peptide-methionine (S)-S-oxide reductase MsrA [Nitrosospira]PTR09103.1 peptide-methionine (S)-S-oxide reductase [Nitrosospira sp. Nsp5]SDQ70917.1 peptide-methionine (S)-S-oxide reductase [Nitrosospira multiformis]
MDARIHPAHRHHVRPMRSGMLLPLAILIAALAACGQPDTRTDTRGKLVNTDLPSGSPAGIATFAGGCFWCTEADFDKVPGVISTTSGYIGGKTVNPTYKQVSGGKTGHIEAVQVRFDPAKTSFSKLLTAFWPTIDPLTPNRQFCDDGSQYRSAIFYHDADQQRQAEASKVELAASGRFTQPIVTEILPATTFYPAEEYHQDYYIKNPIRYSYYRSNCGRDAHLAEVWGITR